MVRRLNEDQEQQIVEAYEAWDGHSPIEGLAESVGVSKQSLYAVLRRRGIPLKSDRRPADLSALVPDRLLDRMADNALRTILEELVTLRRENEQLRQELARRGPPERVNHG